MSCNFNPVNLGYETDLKRIHKDLIIAIVASSLMGSVIMGTFANLSLDKRSACH
jgi:AGZA family xanthine/uracil permease-like MFS transporter